MQIKNRKCFTIIIIIIKNKLNKYLSTSIATRVAKPIIQCRIMYGDWKIVNHLHHKRKRTNDSLSLYNNQYNNIKIVKIFYFSILIN